MATRPKPKLKDLAYRRHSWGAGAQFIDSKVLWADMATTGMTYKAFMHWLRALQVPVLHVGKKRLVRLQSFRLALIAATQLGRPDFLAPGSHYMRKVGKTKFNPLHYTTHLDPEYLRENLSIFIEELLLTKATAGYSLSDDIRQLAKSVADTYITEAARMAPLIAAVEAASKRKSDKNRLINGSRSPQSPRPSLGNTSPSDETPL